MSTRQSFTAGKLIEQWSNATQSADPSPAGYTAFNADGTVASTRALTAAEAAALAAADAMNAAAGNQSTLQGQAQAALVANRTYLAIGSPTNAQLAAQVRALTQQNQGIIRLALQQFDATN